MTTKEHMKAWIKLERVKIETKIASKEATKERRKEDYRNYHIANKDKNTEKMREWRVNNPGWSLSIDSKRRARKLQAIPLWCEKKAIKKLYSNRPKSHHVDHVIPLQNDSVCGLHCLANLEIIPANENMIKHNTFDQDFESAKQLELSRNR